MMGMALMQMALLNGRGEWRTERALLCPPRVPSPWTLNVSQNHRMVGVGRDLWRSSSPTPLPKQALQDQAAQDLVQADFEYLQRRRIHNLSTTSQSACVHFKSPGAYRECLIAQPKLYCSFVAGARE